MEALDWTVLGPYLAAMVGLSVFLPKATRLMPTLVLVLGLVFASACSAAVRGQARRLDRTLTRCGFASGTLDVVGGRLLVWAGGEGPPVVLLHGFGGDARWQLTDVMCRLADHHRVIAPDLLGFGSSVATEPRAVGLLAQADAVAQVMQRLDAPRADVLGTSYGGMVAYRLATHHPERVSRLVLVDSPAAAYTEADLREMLARFEVPSASALFLPEDGAGVRRLLQLAYADPPWMGPALARAAHRYFYDPSDDPRAHLLRNLEGELAALDPDAPRPTMPALVIWGAEDPVFPLAVGRRLADHLSAQLVVIPNARHAPNLEHPARFVDHLRPFLTPREPLAPAAAR